MSSDPIHGVIDNWHDHLRGRFDGGLDEILHEDCVFWSPVVFSPQRGRELTKMYLMAAGNVLPGDVAPGEETPADGGGDGKFRYTKQILDGYHAMLEFETTMGDTSVNGVDIITCDDDGKIVEFKVMIRPKRAMDTVHAGMAAMLEQMAPAD